ncbi:MgtC/SapB family protein [Subsaximicrobium wynnwilliamsii]|uniref:MgtC/SapB family protein n=1 Tax=Subsaximicrobium wynnwilliamsii TaxID=291179 RepID=A0A5C6ZMH2_9FLAO|nr:MgtC/SapB family protein [Subsaximicrobium wynnwilliamsii]TXD84452.1 MgtC/SapB family protein [Subsaximicrobium wynnwilliamsii]TXD90133.1 MgtC/SapB family protein [Subsaximicrobium wynnwilliamsii]TXE04185.1 MgtC/SapB family protein [Subsaximicrobium wynnwilliamsii]
MQTFQDLNELVGSYMLGVLISTGVGLILGLEREFDKLKDKGFAGIRSFPIVTIIGFSLGSLTQQFSNWLVIISLGSFILFLALYHFSQKQEEYGQGLTTNLALIATFILGVMVSAEFLKEAVATAVILVTLLSLKTKFVSIISNITSVELFAFIKFSIIALLILPFLPNKNYGPDNLLNPFEIGSIIVIVSLINFIGYFLVKFVGSKKGIILTAILGGLISSTAVAWNYASKSKASPELSKKYSAGIIVASAIMFPRLALLTYIFNAAILIHLALPFALLTLVCIVATLLLMRKDDNKPDTNIKLGNPLDMLNAIGFGAIYLLILFAVFYSNQFFGERGLYYSAFIAGLADTDAITISMAKFSLDSEKTQLATSVIIAATLSNMLVKLGITALKGSKTAGKRVSYAFGSVILVGLAYIFFNTN